MAQCPRCGRSRGLLHRCRSSRSVTDDAPETESSAAASSSGRHDDDASRPTEESVHLDLTDIRDVFFSSFMNNDSFEGDESRSSALRAARRSISSRNEHSSSSGDALLGALFGGVSGALLGHFSGEGARSGAARGAALGASTVLASEFVSNTSRSTSTATAPNGQRVTFRDINSPFGTLRIVTSGGTMHSPGGGNAAYGHMFDGLMQALAPVFGGNGFFAQRGAGDRARVEAELSRRLELASQSLSSELPYTENEPTTCSICLGDLEDNSDNVALLPCGHSFHKDEILQWFSSQTNFAREHMTSYPSEEAVLQAGAASCPNCKAKVLSLKRDDSKIEEADSDDAIYD